MELKKFDILLREVNKEEDSLRQFICLRIVQRIQEVQPQDFHLSEECSSTLLSTILKTLDKDSDSLWQAALELLKTYYPRCSNPQTRF